MKNLKIKFGLFSLLVVLAVSVFLTSCEQEVIEQSLVTDYIEAEKILGNYIIEQDGIFILTEKDHSKLGIDPQLLSTLIRRFDNMNQLIQEGEIKAEWINKTLDLETMEEITVENRGCNENKIEWGYTTHKIYLSTNTASWVTLLAGLPASWVSPIMSALTLFSNQVFCPCGYIHTIGYGEPAPWGTTACNDVEPCNLPTNVSTYNVTSGKFNLSWKTTNSADYYKLYQYVWPSNGQSASWLHFGTVSDSPSQISAPSGFWCVAVETVCDGVGTGIGGYACADVPLIVGEDTTDKIQVVQQIEVK